MRQIILGNIPALCNDTITQSIAARFAERHANVIAALQRIIPTILGGFVDRIKQGPDATEPLIQLAGEARHISWWQKPLNGIGDAGTMQKGHEMLQQLFGIYNIDAIAKQIAIKTMVRNSTVVKLMQWVAPFCFGAIGKVMAEKKYDAAMLCDSLATESFEPTADNLIGHTGYHYNISSTGTRKTGIRKNRDLSWMPFSLLLVCGGLLYWLLRS